MDLPDPEKNFPRPPPTKKDMEAEWESHARKMEERRNLGLAEDYWRQSGVGERHRLPIMLGANLEAHRQWAYSLGIAREVVKNGGMMAFLGSPGNGKTQMAAYLVWEVVHRPAPALFVESAEMVKALREPFKSRESELTVMRRFVDPVLLVIDEFRLGKTDWEQEQMGFILNKRYATMRPTILTANMARPEFSAMLGPRLCDRFREDGQVIVFNWGSFRGKGAGSD